MGWEVIDHQPDADLAQLKYSGTRILLAGPRVEDAAQHLDGPRVVWKPGDRIIMEGYDLDTIYDGLRRGGRVEARLNEYFWGGRDVSITDPDGSTLKIREKREQTLEQALEFYTRGAHYLEMAVNGLSEEALNRALDDGGWTIRQLVHHIVEDDIQWLMPMRIALAESGRVYIHNAVNLDTWVDWLDYGNLAVGPALALFHGIRLNIAALVRRLPNAELRYVTDQRDTGERRHPIHAFIKIQTWHALEHIETIYTIRRAFDLYRDAGSTDDLLKERFLYAFSVTGEKRFTGFGAVPGDDDVW